MAVESRDLEHRASTLSPRSLKSLLDETFAVYGMHFWRFIGLVAVVQVPVALVSLIVLQVTGDGVAPFFATEVLRVFGTVVAYGAAVFAVGQHYVSGEADIRGCYDRTVGRARTLIILGGVLAIATIGLLEVMLNADQPFVTEIGVALFMIAIGIGIYWSMAVQAVIVEGFKAAGALRRSFALVRGSWWRVFGISLVFGLVALGLGIVISLPFALLSLANGGGPTSGLSDLTLFLGRLVVGITVPPVLFISGTLLYYDLRVRKEEYDFAGLSREMGIARV